MRAIRGFCNAAAAAGLIVLLNSCVTQDPEPASQSTPSSAPSTIGTTMSLLPTDPTSSLSDSASPPVAAARPASYPIVKLPGCANVDLVHGDIAISQERFVPNGDFDHFEAMSGIEGSIAVIEGTVGAAVGPPVTLRRDGYTDYDSANGLPTVIAADLSLTAVFDPSNPLTADLNELLVVDEVLLYHSAGYVEPGRRYAFFLSRWDSTEFAFLYAHDLDLDLPAPGFLSERTKRLLEHLQTFSPQGCNLERVLTLAFDLAQQERGGETSALVDHAFTPPATDHLLDQLETNYASTDIASSFRTDLGDVLLTEILVLADEPGVYSLRGDKDFGRAPINDLGLSVITGFIPEDTTFDSIVWTDRFGLSHEVTVDELGLDEIKFELIEAAGIMTAVLDLTESGAVSKQLGGARFTQIPWADFVQLAIKVGGMPA